MRILMVIIFCWVSAYSVGIAQQPSHFTIGAKEFSNTHVYSLLETSAKQLYAATNHGLYVYKHGKFQLLNPAPEQHGSSLFSLAENGVGELYCSNLAGQIFKLEGEGLVLYTQLPNEHLSSAFEFTFDDQDRIIARSKAFLRFDSKEWEAIYRPADGIPYFFNSFDRDRILFPPVFNKEILSLVDDSLVSIPNSGEIIDDLEEGDSKQFPAYLDHSLITISVSGKFSNSRKKITSKHDLNVRLFVQFEENEIWSLSKTNGVKSIHLSNDSLVVSPLLFKEHFISCITKSENGTIYLGTFGSGVIAIPNSGSMIHSYQENYFTGICAGPEGIIAVNRKGTIHNVSPQATTIYKSNGILERTNLYYVEGVNFEIDSIHKSILYNPSVLNHFTGSYGVIKGVSRVDQNTAIIAGSEGVFRVGTGADHLNWKPIDSSRDWDRYSNTSFRCKAVAYDIASKELYYETPEGLIYVSEEGKEEAIYINGKSINCNHLMYADGFIWCASQSFGVLKIIGGKVKDRIDSNKGLSDNYVRKTLLRGGKLYVSHKSGFQIIDLTTDHWTSIGTAEGITNGSVADFTLYGSKLWMVSNDQIVSLPLNQSEKTLDFRLNVSSVKLADSTLANGVTTHHKYNENRLTVNFDFRGIEFETDAEIQYRLIGSNIEWKNLDATSSEIEFNALAPGQYQFELRVNYRNYKSEPIVYPFVIKPPFWQTWWFYSLVALVLILIAFIVFRIWLRRVAAEQKRRLGEQKLQTDKLELELKALRSQMNPHFIFNSLNSIQDLVLREQTDTSYDYIALFAKLVRNTLNYSNVDYIPIEKELEFIDIYLSLEKLRFGEDFQFTIDYEGDQEIEVPSLLIQPFIENALVHGLIHRKGLKKLSIEFRLTDQLKCIIIDNGVGRKRGKEIQTRQVSKHESFALGAIQKRLDILNQKLGEEIGKYTILDLYEGEEPIGTQVEVIIPHRPQF